MSHLIFSAAEISARLQADILRYISEFKNELVQATLKVSRERLDAQIASLLENGVKYKRAVDQLKKLTEEELWALSMAPAAKELVMAATEDAVADRTIWVTGQSDHLKQALSRWFVGWSSTNPESSHFYKEVVDEMVMKVTEWVHVAIPERTWFIYHLRWVQKDILIEQGMDYRIADWTRRMESGEWQMDEVANKDSVSLDTDYDEANRMSADIARTAQKENFDRNIERWLPVRDNRRPRNTIDQFLTDDGRLDMRLLLSLLTHIDQPAPSGLRAMRQAPRPFPLIRGR